MTISNNFKSRPERLKFIHLLYFGLSGLDLKFLFIVTGAYYESGLCMVLTDGWSVLDFNNVSAFIHEQTHHIGRHVRREILCTYRHTNTQTDKQTDGETNR